jgi:hypothetical protein
VTLTRRLDRLGSHWPHPADVLAARLGAALGAASSRTLENAGALYHRCRALMATADLSEAATARALATAMTGAGFPAEGVRQCLDDMPSFFVLAFACLGASHMSAWHALSDVERQRLNEYLDSLLTEDERGLLNTVAGRIGERISDMTLAQRLDRLHRRYPRGPEQPPALDLAELTMEERFELDAILAKLEGVPLRCYGRPDLSPLSDAELERLDELSERITVMETP